MMTTIRTHFVNVLPIYFLILITIPSIVFSLTCYKCQERRTGDWCLSPSKQKCDSATSICLKYLHKEGKVGFPNHIMAKCEHRSEYARSRINACERSVRKLADGGLTIMEICTCDTDLCNDASLNVSKMVESGKGGDDEEQEQPDTTTIAAPAQDQDTEVPPAKQDGEQHYDEYEAEEDEDQAVEKPEPEEQHDDDENNPNGSAESGEKNAAMHNTPVCRICTAVVAQVVFLFAILNIR